MTPITKLLVANRGEIAARILRTTRALDIAGVAVFSDADADAPFVAMADESVRLPGNSPAQTYLRVDALLEAARRTGADAVHPGYGFLSENAGFARACAEAGLIFVGPPPEAIDAMGSKITAKRLMAEAGVPVLPGITVDDNTAPDELADQVADRIGYPVLVKAAFGGGGRGMRVVRSAAELVDAVAGARREAAAAFGDATVFLERFVDSPRHLEVQIFGDLHGNLVHLFERECSVQRRYQKILEESPSPAVDETLRAELCAAAVAAGKAIGYVGAGTVEFILGPAGQLAFLEVNTRLQVEHPVTELVTGLDLVRLQLLVAEGRPLPDEVRSATISGHAIEARLYAEDVTTGFLPATGPVHRFRVPELAGLRVDAGVADGGSVSVHYDPMIAKLIAHAPTRDEACRLLASGLAGTQLHGVVSNRELLVGILREPEFRAGTVNTGYLDRHDPVALAAGARSGEATLVHALAAALADQAARRAAAPVLSTLPSGWRNVPNAAQTVQFSEAGQRFEVRYRIDRDAVLAWVDGESVPGVRLGSVRVSREDLPADLTRRPVDPEPDRARWLVDLEVDGVRRLVDVHRVGAVSYVDSVLGSSVLTELPRFPDPTALSTPGSLLAPMPGTVIRVCTEPGAVVDAGASVIVLEAMKMEHTITAPHPGTLTSVNVHPGDTVPLGATLAVVNPTPP